MFGGGTLPAALLNGRFYGLKYYNTILKKVGLRGQNGGCRDLILFSVDLKRRNCPSARRASTANAIDGDNDLFSHGWSGYPPILVVHNPAIMRYS